MQENMESQNNNDYSTQLIEAFESAISQGLEQIHSNIQLAAPTRLSLTGLLDTEEEKDNMESLLEVGVYSSPIPILTRSRRVSPSISPVRNTRILSPDVVRLQGTQVDESGQVQQIQARFRPPTRLNQPSITLLPLDMIIEHQQEQNSLLNIQNQRTQRQASRTNIEQNDIQILRSHRVQPAHTRNNNHIAALMNS